MKIEKNKHRKNKTDLNKPNTQMDNYENLVSETSNRDNLDIYNQKTTTFFPTQTSGQNMVTTEDNSYLKTNSKVINKELKHINTNHCKTERQEQGSSNIYLETDDFLLLNNDSNRLINESKNNYEFNDNKNLFPNNFLNKNSSPNEILRDSNDEHNNIFVYNNMYPKINSTKLSLDKTNSQLLNKTLDKTPPVENLKTKFKMNKKLSELNDYDNSNIKLNTKHDFSQHLNDENYIESPEVTTKQVNTKLENIFNRLESCSENKSKDVSIGNNKNELNRKKSKRSLIKDLETENMKVSGEEDLEFLVKYRMNLVELEDERNSEFLYSKIRINEVCCFVFTLAGN